MQHWQEEWEIKQADFLRCIRTFSTMSDVWKALSEDNLNGKAAYAKKKSAIFKAMESEARLKLAKAGHASGKGHLALAVFRCFSSPRAS